MNSPIFTIFRISPFSDFRQTLAKSSSARPQRVRQTLKIPAIDPRKFRLAYDVSSDASDHAHPSLESADVATNQAIASREHVGRETMTELLTITYETRILIRYGGLRSRRICIREKYAWKVYFCL